jgi:predicted nucleic-acid-binding Zn-ribbon protein
MPQSATCVKCGSTDIVLNARVMDRSHHGENDLRVRVDADPNALLFTGTERCPLEARVCGQCGYTELYATDPATLLAAWRRSQESPKG